MWSICVSRASSVGWIVVLLLSFVTSAFPQGADDCMAPDAIAGTGGFPFNRSTAVWSGFNGGDPTLCPGNSSFGPSQYGLFDVFFVWTAASDGDFEFTICGPNMRQILSLHLGSDCSATCIGNNFQGCCDGGSRFPLRGVAAGDCYLVQIADWDAFNWSSVGTLEVNPTPSTPTGDDCAGPLPIAGTGVFPFDSRGATTSMFDGGDAQLCSAAIGSPNNDVFMAWTATESGDFEIRTCGTGCWTRINVHEGADCGAICRATSDVGACAGTPTGSRVVLQNVSVGATFLIQVGSEYPTGGFQGSVEISQSTNVPINDSCANATAVSGHSSFDVDTSHASTSHFQVGLPTWSYTIVNDIFFSWTAEVSGDVQFKLRGDTLPRARIQVYSGSDCLASHLVLGSYYYAGNVTRAQIPDVQSGETLLIQVGTSGYEDPGTASLSIGDWDVLPSNDDCSTPLVIQGLGPFAFDNIDATTSGFFGGFSGCSPPGWPGDSPSGAGSDLFYAWTAPCSGAFRIHNCGATYSTRINVHNGADCDALCIIGTSQSVCGTAPASPAFVATEGHTYLIQVGWEDQNDAPGGEFTFEFTPVGPTACPVVMTSTSCSPLNPHHEGGLVDLTGRTTWQNGSPRVHLAASGGPMSGHGWGLFLVAPSASSSALIGNGLLCLGSPVGRYSPRAASLFGNAQFNSIGRFDDQGQFENFASTANSSGGFGFDVPTALPFAPPGQVIQSGETWYFQLWYRDLEPGQVSSSNLSNVLEAVFP
tara:strand:+ start:2901 stop:5180 length:2280 start_codon:yes stop_codon:yes gene_type:complete